VIGRLLADIVHERFATDLVVRFQDVVDILDDVLIIAHRVSLNCLLDPNDLTVATVMERILLEPVDNSLLAAFVDLV